MMSTGEAQLKLPQRLDLTGALQTTAALRSLPMAERYKLNFADVRFFEPFGMLFFATILRQFRLANADTKFTADGYKQHSYAAHMGFFQTFGLDFGKVPGEAVGSSQYVPISQLLFDELRRDALRKHEDERETIERRSMELASILIRETSGPLHETLTYSLREIFRNVLEHSGANAVWYAAQHWPEKGLVELCILDEGIGISGSLRRNPHLTISSDRDAIGLALLPGISGVAFKGGPRQRNDPWANSGYGLFMTSQLCLRGGNFLAISGEGGVKLIDEHEESFDCSFNGTAVRLQFRTDRIRELGDSLEELRDLGARIAGDLKQQANITASMSSRMLFSATKKALL